MQKISRFCLQVDQMKCALDLVAHEVELAAFLVDIADTAAAAV